MKKFIALALALITLLSLASCGVKKIGSDTPDTDTPNTTNTIPGEITYEERNETVYATENVNIRSSASSASSDNIITTLKKGAAVKRIGYSETWSKIEYDGRIRFVYSEYLSTTPTSSDTSLDEPNIDDIKFTDVDEWIYFDTHDGEETNIKICSTPVTGRDDNVLDYAGEGDKLKRTGIYVEDATKGTGWSRVIYIGEDEKEVVAYTRSYYWTTKAPE